MAVKSAALLAVTVASIGGMVAAAVLPPSWRVVWILGWWAFGVATTVALAAYMEKHDGIHKRTNKGVGGGTGADGAALARETALGTSASPTAGYARVSLTNNTTARAGAGTSLSVPVDTVTPLPSGQYAHSVRFVPAPVNINALRSAAGWPPAGTSIYLTSGSLTAEELAKWRAAMEAVTQPRPLRQMGKLTDYVIGWRSWRLSEPNAAFLCAANREFGVWRTGVNTAVCRGHDVPYGPTPDAHIAPDPVCSCGFYLRHSLGDFDTRSSYGPVVGAVRCWGRIIEHGEQGFRAEHVEIVALLDSGESAKAAAKRYGVPCLAADRIESYAYEFGRTLPAQEAEA